MIKNGVTDLVFELLVPKLKLRVFLMGYTVAMVTANSKKTIPTCWPMIGHLFYTITIIVTDKDW